jgi:dephospho-CoA kinase
MDVMESVKKLHDGKEVEINLKKITSQELRDFFTTILPQWDRDRVHDSDIKKVIQWYNILTRYGITDFKEDLKPTDGENVDDRNEE